MQSRQHYIDPPDVPVVANWLDKAAPEAMKLFLLSSAGSTLPLPH
jgi:hypothetical protein